MLKNFTLFSLFILAFHVSPAQSMFRLDAGAFKPAAHKKFITGRAVDGFSFSFMPDTFGIRGSDFGWTIGYSFYYAWLGQVNVSGVPLESPIKNFADVNVRNDFGGMDLFLRFTNAVDGSSRFMAYADLGAGYRFSNSRLTIRPEKHLEGYEKETREKVGNTSGMNVKMGLGCVYMFGAYAGVNAGAEWTYCGDRGETVDLGTVQHTGNYLELCSTPHPYSVVSLKLGFTFLISDRDPYGYAPPPYIPSDPVNTPQTKTSSTSNGSYAPGGDQSSGSSSDSGSGCLSGFFSSLFSGCLFGGSSDNTSTSSPTYNTSPTPSGNEKPNEIRIKKCCGDEK